MARSTPLIINAALTGMIPRRKDNPHTPIDPDEIVEDVLAVREAGASIVHLHARDREENPTWRPEVYEEIIGKIRREDCDIVLCVSCSGRTHPAFEQRSAVLNLEGGLKPELASLTLGSLNFPRQASVNEPSMIQALAERMGERGILPELEVFDLGMIDYGKYLMKKNRIAAPGYFNLLLGSLGTLSATPQNLTTLVAALPEGAVWGATGIGRYQLPINALAVAMGGHVRVGLEDWLYMDERKERLATNEKLVRRIVRVAEACEREIATPEQARRMLGLPALEGATQDLRGGVSV